MHQDQHPSPLPPDPGGQAACSPLPPDPEAQVSGSPLPPDPQTTATRSSHSDAVEAVSGRKG